MINSTAIKLSSEEWGRIIQLGIDSHIKELESELERAMTRIKEYETKYRMTFVRLNEVGLPDTAGLEEHEDYVEWSSWEGYIAELNTKLDNLHALAETSNGG